MTGELIRVFGRIGLLSFGGPAAQIALMHKELVENRDWLSEDQFLRALSFCMLLPGPEAMQLATYAGWKRQGIVGGLIGGGLFVLPGAVVIMALALAYGAYGNLPVVQALFLGVKATVVIIVIEALIKIAKRALMKREHMLLALGAFIALFFFALPFPLIILGAAVIGAIGPQGAATQHQPLPGNLRRSLRILGIGALIWAAPFLPIALTDNGFLLDIGVFFSTLAVVTFGGAYAVLAYMTQEVVVSYGWLSTPQMMDALGLAETTPGPLILVTQFVGMIAGMAEGGVMMALIAGALTLWVTFVPCFIWIFAGAPLIDWLDGRPRLRGALAGITAAVVGVIANLSLWFALHVFFAKVSAISFGPVQTILPNLTSAQPLAMGLAIITAALLLWRHWPLPLVLLISAVLSLGASAATGAI
ncbi:chromate efflux transporter [Roseobacter sp. CCS2]|uniref:chromate efflux transporter n=1 Tax=Roseobacter sp. CCS2 TaxID=391593 RepID=UPI0000F3C548|nr:chromate efflux transporter [Roseobacter sp. CCS2]EBA11869.1 Chromate transporter [Roseobacter sp. CCS2]